jgi:hypothetical protein
MFIGFRYIKSFAVLSEIFETNLRIKKLTQFFSHIKS